MSESHSPPEPPPPAPPSVPRRAERPRGPPRPRGEDRLPSRLGEPIVYVGDRPTMTYAFEVVGQLNSGVNEVLVKARGRAISRAVDVAEVVRRHRLLEGTVTIGAVGIGTERLTNREGKDLNVSFIQITLTRRPPAGEPAPGPAPPRAEGTASRPPSPP